MSGHVIRTALVVLAFVLPPGPAAAFEARVLESVVSVLPLWPGHERGGRGDMPPGAEPEGSAVAIRSGGYLATALHVVDKATDILVRPADGRLLPARLVGRDPASDLAVLKIEADLPVLPLAPEPALGAPVCAVGNPFGLGLSVTCGVVSGVRRSGVGFNPLEDFIQTDATVNPGASGGALVDGEGRLVGILSAIFTKESDADIGVNFAASAALVARITDDLIDHGEVRRVSAGFALEELGKEERRETVGLRVRGVLPGGAAERVGLRRGDIVTEIAGRRLAKVAEAVAAIQLHRPGDRLAVRLLRDGETLGLELVLPEE